MGGVDADFFNSTAGLRGFKGSVYEGGIRVPCIVRYPGRVLPGTTDNTPSYFPDWFPTLCDLTGAQRPVGLDGESLRSLISNAAKPKPLHRSKPMIWEFHGYRGQLAVMDGKWKAVRQRVRTKKPGPWELYDLEQDPAETANLARKHPKILKRLEESLLADRTVSQRYPLKLLE